MACPICSSPEGAAISDGIRAGAAVLIAVSTIVIGAIVRYGIKVWRADATERTESAESNA